MENEKLLLLDGFSILFRAFYGMPMGMTAPDGTHTGAVYGFLTILFRMLEEERPGYLAVAFDRPEPTFRHELYAEYKGTRSAAPDEFHEQVPLVKEILTAMEIPVLSQPGFEADDILGTLARRAEEAGLAVKIVSGDRDLLQIASEGTEIIVPKTKGGQTLYEHYYPKDVEAAYGVTPEGFIELKALMGDSSDNVPGLPGVGPKTAQKILAQYGTIAEAMAHLSEIKPKKAMEAMRDHPDILELSKELVTIRTDAPIAFDRESLAVGTLYGEPVRTLFRRLGFKSLLRKMEEKAAGNGQTAAAGTKRTEGTAGRNLAGSAEEGLAGTAEGHSAVTAEGYPAGTSGGNPAGTEKESPAGTAQGTNVEKAGATDAAEAAAEDRALIRLRDREALEKLLSDGRAADAAGLSLLLEKGECYGAAVALPGTVYVWLRGDSLPEKDIKDALLRLLPSWKVAAVTDAKPVIRYLWPNSDAEVAKKEAEEAEASGKETLLSARKRGGFFDAHLAAYLLNPLKSDWDYDDISSGFLRKPIASREDLIGKKGLSAFAGGITSLLGFAGEQEKALVSLAGAEAETAADAAGPLRAQLAETEMEALFDGIEMPLTYVLAVMEENGILADRQRLREYGESLREHIDELTAAIYAEAGEAFNLNSPKQLGQILFEKMGLQGGKKTKTGYSTAADVLEKLAPEYPIVHNILEYRTYAKLKSTYADGLPAYIDGDGRIRTTFNQTITATGRLSSTEPNLQNIPMRMELGRLIRKCFYPAPGCVFADADYSQIELRILAHMSGDEQLIEAYREAKDIHRTTAAQVFGVPLSEVTDLMRRNAKAVNFGIVYGISSFGLSQGLSISRQEAADYIERYFATYPQIKAFLDGLVASAKEKGYAVSVFGRRRPVPELLASNYAQRSFGERVAMNSPLQGTAADIMKIAMNRVYDRLKAEGLRARMILQIHDELLIESPTEEAEKVQQILVEEMKAAADLKVTLDVDCHTGSDWYEAK